MLSQRGTIANYYQFFSCPSHRYVHSADVGKEANFTFVVASREADIDNISLLSLKTINRIYTNIFLVFLLYPALRLLIVLKQN